MGKFLSILNSFSYKPSDNCNLKFLCAPIENIKIAECSQILPAHQCSKKPISLEAIHSLLNHGMV